MENRKLLALCALLFVLTAAHRCLDIEERAYYTDQYYIDPEVALDIPSEKVPGTLIYPDGMEVLQVRSYPAEEDYLMPASCSRLLAMTTKRALFECEKGIRLAHLVKGEDGPVNFLVRFNKNPKCYDVVRLERVIIVFCKQESLIYGQDIYRYTFDIRSLELKSQKKLLQDFSQLPSIHFKYAKKIRFEGLQYLLFYSQIYELPKVDARALDFQLRAEEKQYASNKFFYLFNVTSDQIHKFQLHHENIKAVERISGALFRSNGSILLKVVAKTTKHFLLTREAKIDLHECDFRLEAPASPVQCLNLTELLPSQQDVRQILKSRFLWIKREQFGFDIEFSSLDSDNRGLFYVRNLFNRSDDGRLELVDKKAFKITTVQTNEDYEMLDEELVAFHQRNNPANIKFLAWARHFHDKQDPEITFIYPGTTNPVRVLGRDLVCGADHSHILCYRHKSQAYATAYFLTSQYPLQNMIALLSLNAGENYGKIETIVALDSARSSSLNLRTQPPEPVIVPFYPGVLTHLGNIDFVNYHDGLKKATVDLVGTESYKQLSFSRLLYFFTSGYDPSTHSKPGIAQNSIIRPASNIYALSDILAVVQEGFIRFKHTCHPIPLSSTVQARMCRQQSRVQIKAESDKIFFRKHLDILVVKQQMQNSIKFDFINLRYQQTVRSVSLNATIIICVERYIGHTMFVLSSNPDENRINFYAIDIFTAERKLIKFHTIEEKCLVGLSLGDKDFEAAAIFRCKHKPVRFVFFNAAQEKAVQLKIAPKIKLIPAKKFSGACMINDGLLFAADSTLYLVNPKKKGILLRIGFSELETVSFFKCLTADIIVVASPSKLLVLNSGDILANRYHHGNIYMIQNADSAFQVESELVITTGLKLQVPDYKIISLNRVDLYAEFHTERELNITITRLERNPLTQNNKITVHLQSIVDKIAHTRTLKPIPQEKETVNKFSGKPVDKIFDYKYPIYSLAVKGDNCSARFVATRPMTSHIIFSSKITSITTFQKGLLYLESPEGESKSILKYRSDFKAFGKDLVLEEMDFFCRDLTVMEASSFEIDASQQSITFAYDCFSSEKHELVIIKYEGGKVDKTVLEVKDYVFDEIFYIGKKGNIFILALQDTVKKTLEMVEVAINKKNSVNVKTLKSIGHIDAVDGISSALVDGRITFAIKKSDLEPLKWYSLEFGPLNTKIIRLKVATSAENDIHKKAISLFKVYKISDSLTHFAAVLPTAAIELYRVTYTSDLEIGFKFIDRNFYPIGTQPMFFQMGSKYIVLYTDPIKAKHSILDNEDLIANPQREFSGILTYEIDHKGISFLGYQSSAKIQNGKLEKIKIGSGSFVTMTNHGEVMVNDFEKLSVHLQSALNSGAENCSVEAIFGPESIKQQIPACRFLQNGINPKCDAIEQTDPLTRTDANLNCSHDMDARQKSVYLRRLLNERISKIRAEGKEFKNIDHRIFNSIYEEFAAPIASSIHSRYEELKNMDETSFRELVFQGLIKQNDMRNDTQSQPRENSGPALEANLSAADCTSENHVEGSCSPRDPTTSAVGSKQAQESDKEPNTRGHREERADDAPLDSGVRHAASEPEAGPIKKRELAEKQDSVTAGEQSEGRRQEEEQADQRATAQERAAELQRAQEREERARKEAEERERKTREEERRAQADRDRKEREETRRRIERERVANQSKKKEEENRRKLQEKKPGEKPSGAAAAGKAREKEKPGHLTKEEMASLKQEQLADFKQRQEVINKSLSQEPLNMAWMYLIIMGLGGLVFLITMLVFRYEHQIFGTKKNPKYPRLDEEYEPSEKEKESAGKSVARSREEEPAEAQRRSSNQAVAANDTEDSQQHAASSKGTKGKKHKKK